MLTDEADDRNEQDPGRQAQSDQRRSFKMESIDEVVARLVKRVGTEALDLPPDAVRRMMENARVARLNRLADDARVPIEFLRRKRK